MYIFICRCTRDNAEKKMQIHSINRTYKIECCKNKKKRPVNEKKRTSHHHMTEFQKEIISADN